MKKRILVVLLAACMIAGCAGGTQNYEFGAVTHEYCAAMTPEARAEARKEFEELTGKKVPVDVCRLSGLIDVFKGVRDVSRHP